MWKIEDKDKAQSYKTILKSRLNNPKWAEYAESLQESIDYIDWYIANRDLMDLEMIEISNDKLDYSISRFAKAASIINASL